MSDYEPNPLANCATESERQDVLRKLDKGWVWDGYTRRLIQRADTKAYKDFLDRVRIEATKKAQARAFQAEADAILRREVERKAALLRVDPQVIYGQLEAEQKGRWLMEQEQRKLTPNAPETKLVPLNLFSFERKEAGGDARISGYLAVFNNTDSYNDVIEAGAFDQTLQQMRAAPYSSRALLPLLYSHDVNRPIGGFTDLKADSHGLAFQAFLNVGTQLGADCYSNVRAGVLRGMSIGYATLRSTTDRQGRRHLLQIKLNEGSLVSMPANPLAKVQDALF